MTETEGDPNGICGLQTLDSDSAEHFDAKQTKAHKVISGHNLKKRREYKRKVLLLTKPSYTLAHGSKNVRHENRIRLRYLLHKLVRQHNWVEASGVLSTLLKGTCKEGSPQKNRMKYWVAMELFRHMESDVDACSTKIKHLYYSWMEKIRSIRSRPLKDRHVQLEFVLSCLAQNNLVDAHQAMIGLKQEREAASDPLWDLVIGLTNYELWYSSLPKEMQLRNLDECLTHTDLETENNNFYEVVDDMKGDDAASIYETFSNLHYDSETSVMNDKDTNPHFKLCQNEEVSRANNNLTVEQQPQFQPQGFYLNSTESSEERDDSVQDHYDRTQCYSIFNARGLQSLLPLRLPSSDNVMDFLSSYRQVFGEYYKDALKYLKLAFYSPPPVSEAALVPLVQLLLLGDQAQEAFVVIEKSCSESSSVLPFRLKARLWECFDANNNDKLSTSFEDVLKKDPTCRHSLARLVNLHQKGDYASERVVEMIALHLEATYADYIIWREFASCFLKLSQFEEDRISMCVDGEELRNERTHTIRSSRIPVMFVEGISGKTWKLRSKWWLNRHFSRDILTSEMAAGDLQLMTYKAACASHLYGKEMEYVVRFHTYVKEHDSMMLTFLQLHMHNSIGFFSNFVRKENV